MLSFFDIKGKDVINVRDGVRIGYICDILINEKKGVIDSIIVNKDERKLYGFWSRSKEYIIPFESVKKLEGDVVLTDFNKENIKLLADMLS